MTPEQRFAIESPNQELLGELGQLVDEIEELCHQKRPYTDRLNQLNARLSVPTAVEEICSYYGSCTRDEFLCSHLIPDPYQYKNLTDEERLWLIEQVMQNLSNDPLLAFYSAILETNTSSASGTVLHLVVFQNLNEPHQVLAELKKSRERVIRL